MPSKEDKRTVLAVLKLTDLITRLANSSIHSEIASKRLIHVLKSLLAQESQTVRRQTKIIEDLRERCAELEGKMEIVQQHPRSSCNMSLLSAEDIKAQESDENVKLPPLAAVERTDVILKSMDSVAPSPTA